MLLEQSIGVDLYVMYDGLRIVLFTRTIARTKKALHYLDAGVLKRFEFLTNDDALDFLLIGEIRHRDVLCSVVGR